MMQKQCVTTAVELLSPTSELAASPPRPVPPTGVDDALLLQLIDRVAVAVRHALRTDQGILKQYSLELKAEQALPTTSGVEAAARCILDCLPT